MFIKKLSAAGSVIKPPVSKKTKAGLVILKKGEEVGKHITDKREEIIIILQGKAKVIIEGEIQLVKKDSLIYIPEGKKHNLINEFEEELRYIYLVFLSS